VLCSAVQYSSVPPGTLSGVLSSWHCFRCTISLVLFQMYVEVERARLVKRLAKIKEDEGQIEEAADTLQEVAVSARGTPSPRALCPGHVLSRPPA